MKAVKMSDQFFKRMSPKCKVKIVTFNRSSVIHHFKEIRKHSMHHTVFETTYHDNIPNQKANMFFEKKKRFYGSRKPQGIVIRTAINK